MRCFVARGRIGPAGGLAALAVLAGCAAAQRVYSTDPVDRAGQAVPWAEVVWVELESGQQLRVSPTQSPQAQDGRLVLRGDEGAARDGAPASGPPGWPLAQLRRVELRAPDGRTRTVDVLTPDDLLAAEDEPRVERVDLRDGSSLDLDPRQRGPRLDLGGAALDVTLSGGATRRIPLAEVQTLVVARGGLLGSTLRTPAAWLVAGAAAGVLVVIVAAHDSANDAVK